MDDKSRDAGDENRDDLRRSLQPVRSDHIAALARAVAGAAPLVGGAIAEFLTVVIPNQRIERIVKFVEILDARVSRLDQGSVRAQLTDENFNDLLHEGLLQATRALTDERREYIASLLENSLSQEQITHSESKHLLRILGEVSDVEVVILRFRAVPTMGGDEEFREKHKAVLQHDRAHIGASQEIIDKSILMESYEEHLARLGLLSPRYRREPENRRPIGSDTRLEVSGYDITGLGNLLLRRIGIAPPRQPEMTSTVQVIKKRSHGHQP